MKLLVAIKNDLTFKEYLGRLFYSEHYNSDLRTARDIVIMIVFLIYSLLYIVSNTRYYGKKYQTNNKSYAELGIKWNGTDDYKLKDNMYKIYDLKTTEYNKQDIYFNNKKNRIL